MEGTRGVTDVQMDGRGAVGFFSNLAAGSEISPNHPFDGPLSARRNMRFLGLRLVSVVARQRPQLNQSFRSSCLYAANSLRHSGWSVAAVLDERLPASETYDSG